MKWKVHEKCAFSYESLTTQVKPTASIIKTKIKVTEH